MHSHTWRLSVTESDDRADVAVYCMTCGYPMDAEDPNWLSAFEEAVHDPESVRYLSRYAKHVQKSTPRVTQGAK